jgi:carnitine O-acetyltransferase
MNYNLNIQKGNIKPRQYPPLKDTIKTYLKYLKALGSKKELDAAEKLSSDFIRKEGDELQNLLINHNKLDPAWLYNYLLNIYLSRRDPIPFKNNYYILFDFKFKDQVEAVGKLIICSFILKKLLKDITSNNNFTQVLKQFNNKCFYQMMTVFNSYRLPVTNKDELKLFSMESDYVVILYKNVFWLIEVTMDYDKICDAVNYIISMDLSESAENFVGILSSNSRNYWAIARDKFLSVSSLNQEFLFYLERSFLLITMNDKASTDCIIKEINSMCWHNMGQNNFFDKLVTFHIMKDGLVSVNGQKDIINPTIIYDYAKLILLWTQKEKQYTRKIIKMNDTNYFENFSFKPIKLNYLVDEDIKHKIAESYTNFNTIITDFNCDFAIFNEYGKELLDLKGLSPEAFIGLAIIAAYYQTFKKVVPCRQFICGRNFAYGLIEWIRMTTKEAANFSVIVNEMKIPRDLKIKLGLDAFKQYKSSSIEALNGKSIDTHFAGLKSVKNAEDHIQFFNDEMFKKSSQFIIDIHPVSFDYVKLSSHPPYNPEGISITYMIRKDHIQFTGTAYHDLQKYFQSLMEILREMKDLFIEKEREFYNRPKF